MSHDDEAINARAGNRAAASECRVSATPHAPQLGACWDSLGAPANDHMRPCTHPPPLTPSTHNTCTHLHKADKCSSSANRQGGGVWQRLGRVRAVASALARQRHHDQLAAGRHRRSDTAEQHGRLRVQCAQAWCNRSTGITVCVCVFVHVVVAGEGHSHCLSDAPAGSRSPAGAAAREQAGCAGGVGALRMARTDGDSAPKTADDWSTAPVATRLASSAPAAV